MEPKTYSCIMCDMRVLAADLEDAGDLNSKAHVLFTTDVIKFSIDDYDNNEIVVLCNNCYEDVVEEVCEE